MKAKIRELVTKVQAMLGDGYKVSAIDSFKNARSGKNVGFTIHKDGKAYAPVLYLPVCDIAEGNTDEMAGRIVRDFKRVKVDKSILLNSFDTITKDAFEARRRIKCGGRNFLWIAFACEI